MNTNEQLNPTNQNQDTSTEANNQNIRDDIDIQNLSSAINQALRGPNRELVSDLLFQIIHLREATKKDLEYIQHNKFNHMDLLESLFSQSFRNFILAFLLITSLVLYISIPMLELDIYHNLLEESDWNLTKALLFIFITNSIWIAFLSMALWLNGIFSKSSKINMRLFSFNALECFFISPLYTTMIISTDVNLSFLNFGSDYFIVILTSVCFFIGYIYMEFYCNFLVDVISKSSNESPDRVNSRSVNYNRMHGLSMDTLNESDTDYDLGRQNSSGDLDNGSFNGGIRQRSLLYNQRYWHGNTNPRSKLLKENPLWFRIYRNLGLTPLQLAWWGYYATSAYNILILLLFSITLRDIPINIFLLLNTKGFYLIYIQIQRLIEIRYLAKMHDTVYSTDENFHQISSSVKTIVSILAKVKSIK